MKILKQIKEKINEHPKSINETYVEHLKFAIKTAAKLQIISGILILHGICPCVCKDIGGIKLKKLNEELLERKRKCKHARD